MVLLISQVFENLADDDEKGNSKPPAEVKRNKLDIGNLMCFSCSTLDEQPYVSQYLPTAKKQPQDLCNDPFPDISAHIPKEQSFNYLLYERLVSCNGDSGGSIKPGVKIHLSFHCIKIVGIDKESGSNITARGCFRSSDGYIPDRDHIDSGDITFGTYHIQGTAYFCMTDACNKTASMKNPLILTLVFLVSLLL
jgi:hypothetical protein